MILGFEGENIGRKRRCDDRCHFAQGECCECVCGGRLHGIGLSSKFSVEHIKEQLERFQKESLGQKGVQVYLRNETEEFESDFEEVKMKDIVCRKVANGEFHVNVKHQWKLHSPTGFAWGYCGSGPADLALNILLEITDRQTAQYLHQHFNRKFVATLPEEGGVIPGFQIKAWVEAEVSRINGWFEK